MGRDRNLSRPGAPPSGTGQTGCRRRGSGRPFAAGTAGA